ncbi:hypothetical protein UlMin_044477 [Ulmus minor]
MASSSSKVEIEKFDGSNDFGLWKMKMLAHLGNLGLDFALGKEFPESMDEEKKWEVLKKAYNTLILSLSDKVLREIVKCKSAAEVWLKLESLYMTKNLSSRLHLNAKFFAWKMTEGRDLQGHIDDFNKLVMDLENIGVEYEDEDKALVLLYSLPRSYETLVDILQHGRDTISLEDVVSALKAKEQKWKSDVGEQTGYGLFVRGRPSKKEKKEKARSKSRGGRKTISDDGYETADVLVASTSHSDKWIMDSGCSYHMTSNGGWFEDYKEINGGQGEKGFLKVSKGLLVVMKGVKDRSLYLLQGSTVIGMAVTVLESGKNSLASLWHKRFGHVSERGMHELEKQGLFGSDKLGGLDFCEHCVLGKTTRVKFSKSSHTTMETLGYVHSDLWGPSQKECPSSALDFKTPEEVWTGHPPKFDNLRVFGCVAYAHQKQGKLDARAKKCMFVGYPEGVKGYKLCNEEGGSSKCIISRDVVFKETEYYWAKATQKESREDDC